MNPIVYFCEPKYIVSNYIYEFYNTISNFGYLAIGYFNFDKDKKNKYAYSSLVGVGVGSILLHGTGSYFGQLIDEFFMLFFVISTLDLYKNTNRLALISYNICFLSLYLYFKIYMIFLFLFGSQVSYLIYTSYISTEKNTLERNLAITGSSLFLTSKIIWDLEQNFCDSFPNFKWFHSLWHLLSALSGYFILKSNEILYKNK